MTKTWHGGKIPRVGPEILLRDIAMPPGGEATTTGSWDLGFERTRAGGGSGKGWLVYVAGAVAGGGWLRGTRGTCHCEGVCGEEELESGNDVVVSTF